MDVAFAHNIQKQPNKDVSIEFLAIFRLNKAEFLRRFLTMNETRVHHFIPKTKKQSKQQVEEEKSATKNTMTVTSAGKIIASVSCAGEEE